MPGWHEATKEFQADGRVAMVGIIQEQHPQRARLFMQWKQMGWPIMVDAQNQLGVAVVPITILIDEHGIIRDMRPPRRDIAAAVEAFASRSFEPPAVTPAVTPSVMPEMRLRTEATATDTAEAWRRYAEALVNWAGPEQIDDAVAAYGRAVELDPLDGPTQFALGVAYRRRLDSEYRQPGDFQHAVDHWGNALAIDPNQYIWRRRIQQYGPRLDKPYPFYDWVPRARADVEARGETPWPLPVEPSGAEFARPARTFSSGDLDASEPDRDDRIRHDTRGFVLAQATIVPSVARPGSTVRVHLAFRPNGGIKAHWNNEAEPMQVWVDPPEGWVVDRRSHTVHNAPAEASLETRTVEFEVQVPRGAAPGTVTLDAYALYNVCEGRDGTCLYRRGEVVIEIRVAGAAGPQE